MYFPFLRGKQYELGALSDLTQLIVSTEKVIPIVEPMNLNSTTRRVIPELNRANVPLIFIINPQVGDLVSEAIGVFRSLLTDIENKNNLTLGYYITENTTLTELQAVLETFGDYTFAFIHTTTSSIRNEIVSIDQGRIKYNIFLDGRVSTAYQNAFIHTRRILIKDCFNAQPRNADYDNDEYFSDQFSTYRSQYYGFGDYQIVGSTIGGGGPAHAVALHLTYLKERNGSEIWVRHFVSDDRTTTANVQGKYFQSLTKLVDFLDQYGNTPETEAARLYRSNLLDEEFHGLGFPKKLSIMHHTELMAQVL